MKLSGHGRLCPGRVTGHSGTFSVFHSGILAMRKVIFILPHSPTMKFCFLTREIKEMSLDSHSLEL